MGTAFIMNGGNLELRHEWWKEYTDEGEKE
jgi:hypothetical protein